MHQLANTDTRLLSPPEKLFGRQMRGLLHRVHVPLRQRKSGNAWLETDRRERLKLLAVTLAFVIAALGGVAFLLYALMRG